MCLFPLIFQQFVRDPQHKNSFNINIHQQMYGSRMFEFVKIHVDILWSLIFKYVSRCINIKADMVWRVLPRNNTRITFSVTNTQEDRNNNHNIFANTQKQSSHVIQRPFPKRHCKPGCRDNHIYESDFKMFLLRFVLFWFFPRDEMTLGRTRLDLVFCVPEESRMGESRHEAGDNC